MLTPRDNEWLILLVEQPEPQARALGHVLAPVLESVPVPVQAAASVPLPTQVLALALESVQEPVSTLVVALVTVPT